MNVAEQPKKLHYSTLKDTMVPEKQAVLDAAVAYEAERSDPDVESRNARNLKSRLREFEQALPADFPNREWHILIMGGIVASTLGEVDEAIVIDTRSLEHAGTTEQRAISHSNLSEDLRYIGRYQEALDNAMSAYNLNPRHKGYVWNVAASLAKLGRVREAKSIISVFIKSQNESDPTDLFSALTKHDAEMQELLSLE